MDGEGSDDSEDLIAEQTPRFLQLLSNLQVETDKVSEFVSSLHSALSDDGALEVQSDGISLFSLKSHLLLDYVINLARLILHKVEGMPLPLIHDDVINQMIGGRVVMEKIRPLEMKTKYQVDKLVTLATTGSVGTHHPLAYKPNPKNLMPREEGMGLVAEGGGTGAYRPPRISAMPGIVGSVGEEKEERREQDKKKALQSSLIRELREEVADTPLEFSASEQARSGRVAEKRRELERYEEDNFLRLPTSKKQRSRGNRGMNEMESIMDFGRTEFSEEGELRMKGKKGARKKKWSGRAKKKKN